MPRTIWKFPVTSSFTLELPRDAQVLAVQEQHASHQMWVLLNPKAPRVPRHFNIYGTGHVVPDNAATYIATFQEEGGLLVWHLFEMAQPRAKAKKPLPAVGDLNYE